jgi:flagellar export protein FliJ
MYRFRLRRVLEYRQRHEEQVEQEFRAVQRLLQDEETSLQCLQQEYQQSLQTLRTTQDVGILGAELTLYYRYQQILRQKVEVQQAVVAKHTALVTAKQQELLQARQETKILEKLQEKEEKRYLQDLAKQEQHFFDELASKGGHHAD